MVLLVIVVLVGLAAAGLTLWPVVDVVRADDNDHSWGDLVMPVALLGVFVFSLAIAIPIAPVNERLTRDDGGGSQACPDAPAAARDQADPAAPSDAPLATVVAAEGEPLELRFGRNRGVRSRRIVLDVEPPGADVSALAAESEDFTRGDGAILPAASIQTVVAEVAPNVAHLLVCVPQQEDGGTGGGLGGQNAGRYSGRVFLNGPGFEPSTIAFSVTLAYPYWWNVLGATLLTALAATVYIYGLRNNIAATQPFFGHSSSTVPYWVWIGQWNGILSIAFSGAAAITVYSATYLQSPEWGASPSQLLSLIGAVFTSAVAAATTAALATAPSSYVDAPPGAVPPASPPPPGAPVAPAPTPAAAPTGAPPPPADAGGA